MKLIPYVLTLLLVLSNTGISGPIGTQEAHSVKSAIQSADRVKDAAIYCFYPTRSFSVRKRK